MRAARLAGRALLALVAVVVVGSALAPTAGAAQDGSDGGPRVRLLSQTPWVAPGGELVLRLGIAGVRAPSEVELAVAVHAPVPNRTAFAATVADARLGSTLTVLEPVPLASIQRDVTGAAVVAVRVQDPALPRDPERARLRRDGVYPVRVELREADDGPALDGFTTHLVLTSPLAESAPRLGVAWVQTLRAPPAIRPDGEVELPAAEAERLGTIVAALRRHAAVPLTVAPTAESLDALASSDEPVRRTVVADLAASLAGRQVVPGPFVETDLAALVDAGLAGEVATQLAVGTSVLESLLGVQRPDYRTWLTDATVDAEAAAQLGALGVDQLLVPEAALEPLGLSITLTRPLAVTGSGRPQQAAMIDAGLAAHFTSATEGEPADDDVLRAHHLLADLAVLYFDSPGLERGVVVRPPDHWDPTPAFLDTALSGLSTSPIAVAVTVDDLFAGVPPATDDGETLAARFVADRRQRLGLRAGDVASVRTAIAGVASMLPPGHGMVPALDRRVLVAQADGLTAAARRAYLEGIRATISAVAGVIQVPDRTSIRLTAREGTIPLTLRNDADHPLTVAVRLDSDKLLFPDGGCPGADPRACHLREITLEGNSTLEVDVEAPTPGSFPVQVSIRSPDGTLDVRQARLTVRSTAASWVGVALTGGAMLFLLVWWARNWRSVRRDRRLVRTPAPA